jgi:hypothetical protein
MCVEFHRAHYNEPDDPTKITELSRGRGMYRVIHKALRDFRRVRYSNEDGHAEGEHISR